MKIEIAYDHTEAENFVKWLQSHGHDATIGQTSGNFIDGKWTSDNEDANITLNQLWDAYCRGDDEGEL